jgi:hypothetical protein
VLHKYTVFVHQVSHALGFEHLYPIDVVGVPILWYQHPSFDAVMGDFDLRGNLAGPLEDAIFDDGFWRNGGTHLPNLTVCLAVCNRNRCLNFRVRLPENLIGGPTKRLNAVAPLLAALESFRD